MSLRASCRHPLTPLFALPGQSFQSPSYFPSTSVSLPCDPTLAFASRTHQRNHRLFYARPPGFLASLPPSSTALPAAA